MHRRIGTHLLTLTLAVGLVSIAAACTTTTAEPGGGSSTRTDGGSSSGGGSTDDKDDKNDDDDDANGKDCSKETTMASCANCCGYNEQIEAVLDEADSVYVACACEDTCGAACGDFCTDQSQEPSEACFTCLDSQSVISTCGPKAEEICEKNDSCVEFFECEEQSGCSAKEEPDAG
ncbi:MAG: hypothetical protein KF850_42820 [Labilithrix sp.]|nr:hypothetical protein [Labilithrix sp.]MBX3218817.1 hypothetical protein [Labilithrix sp.]